MERDVGISVSGEELKWIEEDGADCYTKMKYWKKTWLINTVKILSDYSCLWLFCSIFDVDSYWQCDMCYDNIRYIPVYTVNKRVFLV